MIYIAIVGSRSRSCEAEISSLVSDLIEQFGVDGFVVNTSPCSGVCASVRSSCHQLGVEVQVFKADLSGVSGYFNVCERYYEKDRCLVDASSVIFAFPSGSRGGVWYEIRYARKKGVVCHVR